MTSPHPQLNLSPRAAAALEDLASSREVADEAALDDLKASVLKWLADAGDEIGPGTGSKTRPEGENDNENGFVGGAGGKNYRAVIRALFHDDNDPMGDPLEGSQEAENWPFAEG